MGRRVARLSKNRADQGRREGFPEEAGRARRAQSFLAAWLNSIYD